MTSKCVLGGGGGQCVDEACSRVQERRRRGAAREAVRGRCGGREAEGPVCHHQVSVSTGRPDVLDCAKRKVCGARWSGRSRTGRWA